MTDYRVADLAREAGTSVRNVRAYQDRGLLPPPRRDGRVVWYSDAHLERLRAILDLLDRGYTLASIGELLEAEAEGRGLQHLVGLGQAIFAPYAADEPRSFTLSELSDRFGADPDALAAINRAVDLDVLVPADDGFVVPDPGVLDACVRLVRAGVPINDAIDTFTRVRGALESVAEDMVDLIATHIVEPAILDDDGSPKPFDPKAAESLTEVIRDVRPIAQTITQTELGHALERAIERRVRARLGDA